MEYIAVTGGNPLTGEVGISGAKNSVLPLLAATVAIPGRCVLRNCPNLTDVDAAVGILRHLGCRVSREGDAVFVDSRTLTCSSIPPELMGAMRSSVLFLGSLMTRMGTCRLSQPGGCPLGKRPIDLHLLGLESMGAQIRWEGDCCSCQGRLTGKTVVLAFPSVGATENLILAALGARGTTTICNAAREPEIRDLAGFLRKAGAKITGDGTGVIQIVSTPLRDTEYRVMPDRMEAVTYLAALAATGGHGLLRGARKEDVQAVLEVLQKAGCEIRTGHEMLELQAPPRLKGVGLIRTAPHPGFPTDAQAPLMAALLRAEGTTLFQEQVFPRRFGHVPALRAMGGKILTAGTLAMVRGVTGTRGAVVRAADLRGGAALVLAALAARGQSRIYGLEHIHRGYDALTGKLRQLGGDIEEVC